MREENVEAVRRAYVAMSAGDLPQLIELTDVDLEWNPDRRVGEGPIGDPCNVKGSAADRNLMNRLGIG
jgi:ketosteroid isomerase-like protein